MSPENVDTIKQISGAVAIGVFQGYNLWHQRKMKTALSKTQALVSLSYADVKNDIESMHIALDNLAVKLNGGERRKPRADGELLTAFGRRWKDLPNHGLPEAIRAEHQ